MSRILADRSGKATHQQTRAHNERLVLRALYDLGPISRADIARLTGLTRTSVGELVAGLLDDGLAREIGRGPSTGGKAPILVELDRRRPPSSSASTSARRSSRGALVDLRGEIRRSRRGARRRPRRRRGPRARLRPGRRAARRGDAGPILGIGVGTPGIVDTPTGRSAGRSTSTGRTCRSGDLLRERYGLPVDVANDSRAAALAEYLFGGRGPSRTSSRSRSGAASAPASSSTATLFHGDGFGAGEIGHIVVGRDGAACHCGRFGCLETVASAAPILRTGATAAGWTRLD